MKKPNSIVLFLRKNALYLVLALCIIAIGLSVTLVLIRNSTPLDTSKLSSGGESQEIDEPLPPDTPDTPTSEVITFIMPVAEYTSLSDYSESMVFNSTLNRYSSHKAVDIFAPEGTSVFAVYGGTVESIENTLLTGITVTIDHGQGVKTVYNSINDTDELNVGDVVKQGDVIGTVSVTNRQEYKSGAHLHFGVMENGAYIDPVKYLDTDNK